MITLTIDEREAEAPEGSNLLEVCLENGIYIPNLCHLKGEEEPEASCRLCFVEVDGKTVPACTVKVTRPLTVKTDTPEVRRLQRSALRLLLSVHEVDCAHCPANKKCALQDLAKFLGLGLKPKGLERLLKELPVVEDHPVSRYYPNRCVLCGRCVRTCRTPEGKPQMVYVRRGFDTVISFFGTDPGALTTCESCGKCVEICPVGAIVLKEKGEKAE